VTDIDLSERADSAADIIRPRESEEDREERRARTSIVTRLQGDIVGRIDAMIDELREQPVGEEPREYLEALRVLLKSQATAYLTYVTGRRDALSPTTSTMYAGELSPSGPVPVTLRGLIEGGTLSKTQAARLASSVLEHRTLLIFGDRSTGKSTLLNALLDLMPVDERVVAIEHGDHLPALEDRSFCTRLTVEDGVDVAGVFARAVKMQPSRIIVGEIHADEMLHFLTELSRRPEAGGFCTVRADSVHMAVAKLLRQMELSVAPREARELVGAVRPVLAHMRSDERGEPRLAAIWAVEGLDTDGEILLHEAPADEALAS
jgi:type IV secretory pathway ATPase VirB11/archaellum biosynthesis ATPase